MDYYYALLNSYSLLKKRKFKLSIHERGIKEFNGEDLASLSPEEKIEKLTSAAGQDTDNRGNLNGVDLWKKDGNILASDPAAKSSGGQSQVATIVKDGEPGGAPTAKKLWGQIFPKEEETPAEEPSGEEAPPEEAPPGEAPPEEGPTGEQPLVPEGPNDAAIEGIGASLDALAEMGATEAPPEDPEDPEAEPQDAREILREQVENSTNLTPEQVQATLGGAGALLSMTENVLENKEEAAKGKFTHDINTMIKQHNITINEEGIVTFDGVSFSTAATQDNPINIGLQKSLEAIQESQDLNVKEFGIGSEAIGIEEEDEEDEEDEEEVTELPSEATIKGSESAVRGITAEAMDSCAPKMNAWVTSGRGKTLKKGEREEARDALIECVSTNMQNKGIDVDTVLNVLGTGMNTELGKILANKDALKDSHTYQFIKESLVRDLGLSPKESHTLLMDTIEGGNGAKAIFVVMLANRQFTTNLFGEGEGNMVPSTTRSAGQAAEAQDPGNKADVVDVFCKEDPRFKDKKAIADHYGGMVGSDESTDDKGCFGGVAGTEDLVQEEEDCEECESGCFSVSREMKVHDKGTKPSVLGETSVDNIGRACGDKGGSLGEKDREQDRLSDAGQKFIEDQKGRLEKCGVNTGPACKGLAAIQEKISKVTNILVKGGATVSDVPALQAAETQIGSAMILANSTAEKRVDSNTATLAACTTDACRKKAQKGVDKAIKNRNDIKIKWEDRKAAALRCMTSKKGEGSKTDCKELRKTKDYVTENMLAKELDEYTNDDGTMTKEGEDMMLTLYSISAGSQTETFNDKRMLQGSAQKVSYRNRNISDNITAIRSGKGRIVREKGAKTTRIEVGGKLQASLTIEKGTTKVKAPHTVGTSIGRASDEKQEEPGKESPKAALKLSDDEQTELSEFEKEIGAEAGKYSAKERRKMLADKKKEIKARREENIFMEFLKGQQKLLESLFNQTT